MASRRLLVASLATLRASRGFLPHASRRRHFGAPRAEEDYIESTTNALVKRFKRCHRKKHRDAENVVLVEGRAFVAEALARGDDVEAVLVADDVSLDAALLARAKRFARAPDFVLKAVSTTDSPQGCVALVARPRLAFPAAPDFLLALDGVQDPGNVGALIRTAAAAGVDGVVLVGACADAFNPKTIRGSAGAALRVPLAARTSLRRSSPPAMLLDGEMPHAGDAEDLEDELLEYAMTFNPYADQADPDQFSGEVSPMASKRDEDDAPMDAEGFARIRERARLRAEGKPLQVWAHGADPADNVPETPAHVPTPPSAAQISAADALFATALRSDEPDGFGDFSDEFLENFGV
jgi:hypothetical protein